MDTSRSRACAVALGLLAAGCAGDLRLDHGGGDSGVGDRVVNVDLGGSVTSTRVDATRNDQWTFLDLEEKAETFPARPGESMGWDLGFQRFKIKTNGGVNGPGAMEVAALPGQSFEALAQAPASGYVTDQDDSADEGSDPDWGFLVGAGWYSYSLATHTVVARDVVYVVRSVEGRFFKVQLTGYYDGAGTGGFPTFRWAPVDAP